MSTLASRSFSPRESERGSPTMAKYYVTMTVETGGDDDDTDEVEQTLRDAVAGTGWAVVSMTVVET